MGGHNRKVGRDKSKVQGSIIAGHTECAAACAQDRVVHAVGARRFSRPFLMSASKPSIRLQSEPKGSPATQDRVGGRPTSPRS